jgi:hypothetical protein
VKSKNFSPNYGLQITSEEIFVEHPLVEIVFLKIVHLPSSLLRKIIAIQIAFRAKR